MVNLFSIKSRVKRNESNKTEMEFREREEKKNRSTSHDVDSMRQEKCCEQRNKKQKCSRICQRCLCARRQKRYNFDSFWFCSRFQFCFCRCEKFSPLFSCRYRCMSWCRRKRTSSSCWKWTKAKNVLFVKLLSFLLLFCTCKFRASAQSHSNKLLLLMNFTRKRVRNKWLSSSEPSDERRGEKRRRKNAFSIALRFVYTQTHFHLCRQLVLACLRMQHMSNTWREMQLQKRKRRNEMNEEQKKCILPFEITKHWTMPFHT